MLDALCVVVAAADLETSDRAYTDGLQQKVARLALRHAATNAKSSAEIERLCQSKHAVDTGSADSARCFIP